MISFGVAGGLAPDLRPGDWIVGSSIIDLVTSHATDFALSRRLLNAVPEAEYAPIAGVDAPLLDPAAKHAYHRKLGAAAVDMESHLVARFARARGLAFGAIRVVIDPAHRAVPASALAGMRPNGETDLKAVLRQLLTSPRQVGQLARVSVDALAARRALFKLRRLLGPGLGVCDPQYAVDQPPIRPRGSVKL